MSTGTMASEALFKKAYKLALARAEIIQEARVARMNELGLVPGETVLMYKGERYQFACLNPGSERNEKPWLRGRKFKKDGTLVVRLTTIWGEWEIE
jgi:hypothetical protein